MDTLLKERVHFSRCLNLGAGFVHLVQIRIIGRKMRVIPKIANKRGLQLFLKGRAYGTLHK